MMTDLKTMLADALTSETGVEHTEDMVPERLVDYAKWTHARRALSGTLASFVVAHWIDYEGYVPPKPKVEPVKCEACGHVPAIYFGNRVSVECNICGASAAFCSNRDAAVRNWNRLMQPHAHYRELVEAVGEYVDNAESILKASEHIRIWKRMVAALARVKQ